LWYLSKDIHVDIRSCKIKEEIRGTPITQCVPLATEPGISLIILPLITVLQQLGALQTHTIDTFLFISHTANVPLFKFRYSIVISVRIIKEMPGSVASGTHCIYERAVLGGLTELVRGTPLFSAHLPHIHRGETINLYADYLVVKDVQFQFVLRIGQPNRFLLRNGTIDFQRKKPCDI
jgi:hypothetical protein